MNPNPAPGIEFRKVSKRYGNTPDAPLAVNEISFSVASGTLTTILGPSGCGKTTTLRMIAGLENPSGGEILIAGKEVTHLGPAQRDVSLVFQGYALFPHMNVIRNVAYGLNVSGVPKQEASDRAHAALASVGLVGYENRLPSELSGGQQQRVAVARAIVLQPTVLLFDEPLSNLDARLRRNMREDIRALQQRLKLTVVYVTHDQTEAMAVSDNVIIMNRGIIEQMGSPQQLYEQPVSEFVAGFMGEASLWPGEAMADGCIVFGPAEAPLRFHPGHPATPGPVKIAVRPEAWRVEAAGHAGGLAASVRSMSYLGSNYELTLDTEIGEVFVISQSLPGALSVGGSASLLLRERGVSVVPAVA